MGLGIRHGAIWIAFAVLGGFLLLMALGPAPASACALDGPCTSAPAKVLCPFPPAGKGTGVAEFDVPKGARNLRYTIKDAGTGQVYSPGKPICSGTTMTVKEELVEEVLEDTYKVTYELTSDGSSNPLEEHDVVVVAEWDLTSDLGVTKTLVGGGDSFGAEEEVTFAVSVHNYGPAPTNGIELADGGVAFQNKDATVTGIEQVAGPKASKPPAVNSDRFVTGEWGKLQPGEEIIILVHVRSKAGKGLINLASAKNLESSHRLEPDVDPHVNFAGVKFDVKPAPDSKISQAGADGAGGTAKGPAKGSGAKRPGPGATLAKAGGVKKVQVAVLRLGGGKALQGGLPEKPTKKPGGCKWLASRSGTKFKGRERAANGYCDSPVWLDATGTTHWTLELAHSLPFGKYVVYSRAVGTDGVAESEFTAKDGNRKAIFVH